MLCYRDGFRCRWNPGPFLEDFATILLTPDIQFRAVMSTIVRIGPMSTTPCAKVCTLCISALSDVLSKLIPDDCRRFDKETGLLYPSKAEVPKDPSKLTILVLKTLSTLRLTEISTNPETGGTQVTNFTILNVFLLWFGPMKEDALVKVLIRTQVRQALFRSISLRGVRMTDVFMGLDRWKCLRFCCEIWTCWTCV